MTFSATNSTIKICPISLLYVIFNSFNHFNVENENQVTCTVEILLSKNSFPEIFFRSVFVAISVRILTCQILGKLGQIGTVVKKGRAGFDAASYEIIDQIINQLNSVRDYKDVI